MADAGWGFGEGKRSGPPPHQLGSLEESYHYPHPRQKKNILGFARILWPCLATVGGRASLCPPPSRGYATG